MSGAATGCSCSEACMSKSRSVGARAGMFIMTCFICHLLTAACTAWATAAGESLQVEVVAQIIREVAW